MLPFQEQIIYQKPWDSYFRKLDLIKNGKEETKSDRKSEPRKISSPSIRSLNRPGESDFSPLSESIESPDEQSTSQLYSESPATPSLPVHELKTNEKVLTRKISITKITEEKVEPKIVRRKSSAPFPVYEIPPEKVRIEKWNKFCEDADLKSIEIKVHDTTFTYQDIEGFKGNHIIRRTKHLNK